MATTYLSPVGNEQQNDPNGAPLAGGFIYTYAAGTTTPIATYMDNAGSVSQANPIVLNSSGLPSSPIWLPAGRAVKLVIQNAAGVTQRTVDNVTGINDPSGISVDQWVIYPGAPSYVSASSFSVAGDQSNTFQIGRRVRSANSGGTVYGTITNVAFTTVTTVTVVNDSGVLDPGLSQVSYGLISQTSSALPRGPAFSAYQSAAQSVPNTTFTRVQLQTKEFDTANAFDNTTNYRFQPNVAGYYQLSGATTIATAAGMAATIFKNGLEFKRGQLYTPAVAGYTAPVSALVFLNGSSDYVELYAYQASGAAANMSTGAALTYFQGVLVRPA